jgi:hypothetical protein
MPIDNRDLAVGTVLTARYKKQDRACDVVGTPDGVRFRLDDGSEHRSPSSAGKAAMDGIACNGWRFWSVQGTEPTRREPKLKAEKPATTAKAKRTKKTSSNSKKSGANKPTGKPMRAASKSDSYGCGACGETFGTMKAATKHALMHTSS